MPINNPSPALLVSIHDVTPATWPACLKLIRAIEAVSPMPLSLLVVPDRHRREAIGRSPGFISEIAGRQAQGDEIVLHGYYHLDEAPAHGAWDWARRHIGTQREGEFAGLSSTVARERLLAGLELFQQFDWQVQGFVAPAWLLNAAAWQALATLPFAWTSTIRGLWRLPQRELIPAMTLMQSWGSHWRRQAFCRLNELLAAHYQEAPLLRMALHPPEAEHPELLRHWQHLIEQALQQGRQPLTKSAFLAQVDGRQAPLPSAA